jgi:hypothetical protein
MGETVALLHREGNDHREDRLPVLDRRHPPRRETAAVAQPPDLVDDRHGRIARQDEIGVQRMRQAVLHRPTGGDHRLADHLSAEHARPSAFRADAAEQVHLDRLEVQELQQVDRFGHELTLQRTGLYVARQRAQGKAAKAWRSWRATA